MLAALVFTLGLSIGPNGYLFHQQLAPPARAGVLPTADLGRFSRRLWLVWHERDGAPPALYAPPDTPTAGLALLLGSDGAARLLPGLQVPRIFLYAPHYRAAEGGVRPPAQMAVDTADHYFHALFEAYLQLELAVLDAPLRSALEQRAASRMQDVPPDQQLAAYLGALTAFGGHLLAVANEIERSEIRRRARGSTLCGLFQRPGTLFTRWREVFTTLPFSGDYRRRGTDGRPSRRVASRATLTPDDKRFFVRDLLGSDWTGMPEQDFARLCARRQP